MVLDVPGSSSPGTTGESRVECGRGRSSEEVLSSDEDVILFRQGEVQKQVR